VALATVARNEIKAAPSRANSFNYASKTQKNREGLSKRCLATFHVSGLSHAFVGIHDDLIERNGRFEVGEVSSVRKNRQAGTRDFVGNALLHRRRSQNIELTSHQRDGAMNLE